MVARKVAPKLQCTKKYSLFGRVAMNRKVHLSSAKRRLLRRSMEKYGFMPAYPIHCVRIDRKLVVKDGQHRLAVARDLGLPVYYVVTDAREASIPELNATQVPWSTRDFAEAFAKEGNKHYAELIDFVDQHNVGISIAVGILASNSRGGGTVMQRFRTGTFKVTSRELADRVVRLYLDVGKLCKDVKTRFFLCALFAVCHVEDFDDKRLLSGARRCPEALMKYGSRDGYLDMIEHAYNYGRRDKVPVKIPAQEAAMHRNPNQQGKDNA